MGTNQSNTNKKETSNSQQPVNSTPLTSTPNAQPKGVVIEEPPCEYCTKQLLPDTCFKNYKALHSMNDSPPFVCYLCRYKFQAEDAMHAHLKNIHMTSQPHSCDQCD